MKIFIAGCARSGTTLTRSLMGCFDDVFVFPPEGEVEAFGAIRRPESVMVVKRTATSYRRLPRLPAEIGLIYCIRHPFDTLTSSHPETRHLRPFHVTPERWRDEYVALIRLREVQPDRQIFYCRYEDLVCEPDRTQQRMAGIFALTVRRSFSADPENPIRTSSVKKWERNGDLLRYRYGLPLTFLSLIIRFCNEFDYELPKNAQEKVPSRQGLA